MYCIREMQIDDYEKVFELWSVTQGMGLSEADSEESIANFLTRNQGLSFVCLDGNLLIGTVLCGHDGRRGALYHVAVHKDYQHKGIGRRLVEKALHALKSIGIAKCHLMVYADNALGQRFWNKIGWTKRDEIVLYSKDTKA